MQLCDYGCGNEAKFQFKNGKWCCSKNFHSCLTTKTKIALSSKGRKHTEETKNKISEKLKGNEFTEDHKKKLSDINKGKKHTYKTKEKISKKNKGRKPSNETKRKMSECRRGEKNHFFGKIHSDESKRKISEKLKGKSLSKEHKEKLSDAFKGIKNPWFGKKITIKEIKKKYPLFSKIEMMRYNPGKPGEKEIQVHCKNHNCSKSKEHCGWFTPTKIQLSERIRQLESPEGNGGSYFYCSDECKNECPLFNLKSDPFTKNEKCYTDSEYQIFRQTVLERDNNVCQYCGELAEHVHHEIPQKINPYLTLDPETAISVCRKCHYEKGHKDECSTGKLANFN